MKAKARINKKTQYKFDRYTYKFGRLEPDKR